MIIFYSDITDQIAWMCIILLFDLFSWKMVKVNKEIHFAVIYKKIKLLANAAFYQYKAFISKNKNKNYSFANIKTRQNLCLF